MFCYAINKIAWFSSHFSVVVNHFTKFFIRLSKLREGFYSTMSITMSNPGMSIPKLSGHYSLDITLSHSVSAMLDIFFKSLSGSCNPKMSKCG